MEFGHAYLWVGCDKVQAGELGDGVQGQNYGDLGVLNHEKFVSALCLPLALVLMGRPTEDLA